MTSDWPQSSEGRQEDPAAEAPTVAEEAAATLGAAERERSARGGAADDEAFEPELNTVRGGATARGPILSGTPRRAPTRARVLHTLGYLSEHLPLCRLWWLFGVDIPEPFTFIGYQP